MANTSRFTPGTAAVAGLSPQDPQWRLPQDLEEAVLTSRAQPSEHAAAAIPEQLGLQISPVPVLAPPWPVSITAPSPSVLLSRDPLTVAMAKASRAVISPSEELAPPASIDLDAMDGRVRSGRCSCAACNFTDRSPAGAATVTTRTSSASSMPMGSLQTLADYLTTGYWQEDGTFTRKYNLTNAGTGAKSGVITYNVTGWADDGNGLSTERRALAREVFKLYSAMLGISFREVTGSGGDIRFTDNDSGAYAYMASGWYADSTRTKMIINYSVVNVASSWHNGKSNYNTYTPQTFFHEIGHALGLGHQGQYNYAGTPLTYESSAQFANDSWLATMMSYWDQSENPTTGASFAWLQTPMAVDWIALNDLYGSQGYSTAKAFLGDTVYGVGTNISASQSQIWNLFSTYAGSTAYTLVDGGGYDALDVSNFNANQLINLAPSQASSTAPSVSNIGGKIGNLSIAAGTVIEAARGGGGSDVFYGNSADNSFWGNGGSDQFYDSLGSDTYYGDDGIDWLYFEESIDLLTLSFSNDWLSFARQGGGGVDRAWTDIENFSFNSTAYTYDQLLASIVTNPPPLPTATLSAPNNAGGSVNEGATLAIEIATTNLAQGSTLYWQLSGTGINTSDFVGLASLSGSATTDASGKATVNLSIRADASTEGNEQLGFALFSDAGLTSQLADLTLTIQDTSLTPTVTNQIIWGTTASDTRIGGAGDDRITGVLESGTTAAAMGRGQIDRLTGQAGADVIVLGDSRGVFYDDRTAGNLGTSDYALITDFLPGQDSLQLRSAAYRTTVSGGNLSLYWDRNNNGRLDTSGSNRDELIAILQGVTSLSTNDIIWV